LWFWCAKNKLKLYRPACGARNNNFQPLRLGKSEASATGVDALRLQRGAPSGAAREEPCIDGLPPETIDAHRSGGADLSRRTERPARSNLLAL
jgi:hypothetical protein